ncbi:MAG TPA: ATP phosphoribosyltransferase regulatory subunit [Campylobacterales bacterium]|nr:ATP phosphoribosyltransferase regulatory subunit [Campylobacterales bacterium]
MIQKHEIPANSRLYFLQSANIKREIEYSASRELQTLGYAEIVTPYFSYHQETNLSDRKLLKLSDRDNNTLCLRADSTIDVVRIITKRLGRSIEQKKWFYIQPVFSYPSTENYQIGGEILENSDLSISLRDSIEVLKCIDVTPILQISNTNIPQILSQSLDIPLEVFKSSNIQKLLDLKLDWLTKLTYIQYVDEIKEILDIVPSDIKEELLKILKLCEDISYEKLIISPLYYARMDYYDGLFFRYIDKNSIYGMGGSYEYEDINATGFALYVDKLIEEKF